MYWYGIIEDNPGVLAQEEALLGICDILVLIVLWCPESLFEVDFFRLLIFDVGNCEFGVTLCWVG